MICSVARNVILFNNKSVYACYKVTGMLFIAKVVLKATG